MICFDGLLPIRHEIRRELLQTLQQRIPGSSLGQQHHGVSDPLDEYLISGEAKFFGQSHCLALSVLEQLCRFHRISLTPYILKVYTFYRRTCKSHGLHAKLRVAGGEVFPAACGFGQWSCGWICMKFLPLIWAGIWRKPGRTILIVLQVAVAFVLFGVLQGMKTGVEAAKYGWKVGDRIPLTSVTLKRDGSGSWVFDVVGTFTPHEVNGGSFIVGNYTYLDESRMTNKGTVRNFYVATSDPRSAAAVSEAIDRTFANAPSETNTASLRESAQQAMQRIGDLNFMVRAILTPVFAALLFSIGTLLLQGIRERTPELAVLKTLGFTDRAIFLL